MKRGYQVVRTFASDGRRKLARFLAREGPLWLLPMLDLIETGQVVVDQFIDVVGRIALKERPLRVFKPRLRKKGARRGKRDWPSAAASLGEGLEEMYTINRLNLPGSLRRCLASTNLIDSTDSGVRQRTRRVTNWQDAAMAQRWAAAAFVQTEKHYRRIMGYEHLWVLEAFLDEPADQKEIAKKRSAG